MIGTPKLRWAFATLLIGVVAAALAMLQRGQGGALAPSAAVAPHSSPVEMVAAGEDDPSRGQLIASAQPQGMVTPAASRPGVDLEILVVDERTGSEVADAWLAVDSDPMRTFHPLSSGGPISVPCFHASGQNSIPVVSGLSCPTLGGSALEIRAPGYSPTFLLVPEGHWERPWRASVRLVALGSLELQASDSGGRPIVGATLRASFLGRSALQGAPSESGLALGRVIRGRYDSLTNKVRHVGFLGIHDLQATTNSMGLAILSVPAITSLDLTLEEGGRLHSLEPVTVQPEERRFLEWTRRSGGIIQGYALNDDGLPVDGLRVRIASAPDGVGIHGGSYLLRGDEKTFALALSDSSGWFVLEEIPEGAWLVAPEFSFSWPPSPHGLAKPGALAVMAIVDNSLAEPVEIRILQPLYLVGRLKSESDSLTMERATVIAKPTWCPGECTVQATADGRFWVGPIAPGEYDLVVETRSGRTTPVRWNASYPSPNTIELPPLR